MVLCGELASLLLSELPLNSRFTIGLAKSLQTVDHINNPSLIAPSSALRMSINTGESSFFGEKYLVEKVSIRLKYLSHPGATFRYSRMTETLFRGRLPSSMTLEGEDCSCMVSMLTEGFTYQILT